MTSTSELASPPDSLVESPRALNMQQESHHFPSVTKALSTSETKRVLAVGGEEHLKKRARLGKLDMFMQSSTTISKHVSFPLKIEHHHSNDMIKYVLGESEDSFLSAWRRRRRRRRRRSGSSSGIKACSSLPLLPI
jgi:hypothetical protein